MCPPKDDDKAVSGSPEFSLMKLMTTRVQDLSWPTGFDLPGGLAGRSGQGSLEHRVEDLIAEAEKKAEATGQSIESVLQSMGVLSPDPTWDDEVDHHTEKGRLADTLDWQIEKSSPAQPKPTRSSGKMSAEDQTKELLPLLLTRHPGAAPDELTAFMTGCLDQDNPACQRLRALGLIREGGIADPETFCAEAPFLPGFPPKAGAWKQLFEQMLMDEVFGFRAYQEVLGASGPDAAPVHHALVDRDLLSATDLADRLGSAFGLPVYNSEKVQIREERLKLLPLDLVELFSLIPVEASNDTIYVGLADPPGPTLLARLAEMTGHAIDPVLLPLDLHKTLWSRVDKKLKTLRANEAIQPPTSVPVREILTKVSSVKIVQEVFEEAIAAKATDIHFDPKEEALHIRFRVDSVLTERLVIPDWEMADEVMSRIKILADLDTTERRRPQDGHIRAKIGDRGYDMRIATVPTYSGERMAIRIADPTNVIADMTSLGLQKRDLDVLLRLIERPYGMLLATGPVGSGKTTSLYTCLRKLDGMARNIMTIEDPVENELATANQISVNYRIGFDFVKGLRSILRHDPDVILVGEVRDEETARIAVRASLTGLLVLSTLHAHTSVGAVTALLNFGIPPFLMSNSVLGVVAQRLVRRICPKCMTSYKPSKAELDTLGLAGKVRKLTKGLGCAECHGTGYQGRTGVFEVLDIAPDIRELILEGASEVQLAEAAVANGMTTLKQGGVQKVLDGITTIAEVNRVLDF